MARVRVMVWNLQNLGALGESYTDCKGIDSTLLAEFVTDVVRAYAIDVLMVLEVMPSALSSLNNILLALNRGLPTQDWCYDWVKCAVEFRPEVVPPEQVVSRDKLAWRASRFAIRPEAYAVFWRNSQTDRFTMQQALINMSEGGRSLPWYRAAFPAHAIELSLWGRGIEAAEASPWVQAREGFRIQQPDAHWEWSTYPDISKYGNLWTPRWDRTRRPAIATIVLNTGGGRVDAVPLVAYHAPSRRGPARMAVYLSGLAHELYVVPNGAEQPFVFNEKAIALGDYNLDTYQEAWDRCYVTYHRPFGADSTAGAAMTALNTVVNRTPTSLRLERWPNREPITSRRLADYYTGTIDNIFHRGLTNARAWVCPLPAETFQNGAFTGTSLRRWATHLEGVVARSDEVDPRAGPLQWEWIRRRKVLRPIFPHMTDWTAFSAAVDRGYFLGDPRTGVGDEAREAAVFIHDFVSDHLPLYVEFDVA